MATGHPIDVLVLSLNIFQEGKKKKVKSKKNPNVRKEKTQHSEDWAQKGCSN